MRSLPPRSRSPRPAEESAPAEEAVIDEPSRTRRRRRSRDPAEEAVIDEPLEDEASADDPSDQLRREAPAASDEPAASEAARRDPGRGSEHRPRPRRTARPPTPTARRWRSSSPASRSTTDTTAPPSPGRSSGSTTTTPSRWRRRTATWKTLDAEVGDAAGTIRDYEATIDGLKPGKEYTVRIVTAETEALAEAATEDAVDADVAGPGLGSVARAAVRAGEPSGGPWQGQPGDHRARCADRPPPRRFHVRGRRRQPRR